MSSNFYLRYSAHSYLILSKSSINFKMERLEEMPRLTDIMSEFENSFSLDEKCYYALDVRTLDSIECKGKNLRVQHC